jgi:hypothetical protein
MTTLTDDEMNEWLTACELDPSIIHPSEMGYLPDGTNPRERIRDHEVPKP